MIISIPSLVLFQKAALKLLHKVHVILISLTFSTFSLNAQMTESNSYSLGDLKKILDTDTSITRYCLFTQLTSSKKIYWDCDIGHVNISRLRDTTCFDIFFDFPENGVENIHSVMHLGNIKAVSDTYFTNIDTSALSAYSEINVVRRLENLKSNPKLTSNNIDLVSFEESGEILMLSYDLLISSLLGCKECLIFFSELPLIFPVMNSPLIHECHRKNQIVLFNMGLLDFPH